MGATVWQRDESGGRTFTVGVAPAAAARTPQQPSQRPGKRKKLTWSRGDATGTPDPGHPNPDTATVPGAAAEEAAQPAKRPRAAAVNGSSKVAPVPAQHRTGKPDSAEASATDGGLAANGTAAAVAPPVKPPDKAALGAGLARQLRQKEVELARMREEMYAKQRRLHQEQARADTAQHTGRAWPLATTSLAAALPS